MPRNESALDTPAEPVTIEIEGVTHAGVFRTGRGYVMLDSAYGRAAAPRGRLAAPQVAAMLLKQLVMATRPTVGP
jgi:hypothetical protein